MKQVWTVSYWLDNQYGEGWIRLVKGSQKDMEDWAIFLSKSGLYCKTQRIS